jgi:hypothetical protein
VIDAGGEEEMLTARERRVEAGCRVDARLRDVELVDRHRAPRRRARPPARPLAVRLQRGDHHVVRAARVHVEERLLTNVRRGRHGRVRRARPCPRGGLPIADEDHVPVAPLPVGEIHVPREELLLRAGADLRVDLRVGDEAAARPAAVVVEGDRPHHVRPPERGPLRDRPDVDVRVDRLRRDHGEVLRRAPEVARRVVVPEPVGLGAHGPGDDDVVR